MALSSPAGINCESTCSANFPGEISREVLEKVESPGTHRGHNKLFLVAPRTPSSASAFLQFVIVTFSHPAFTAVTRVQIPSGTPNLFNRLRGFHAKSAVQRRYNFPLA